ncbi:MAG: TlpA family protein disulfide reductase [Gemmatimonadota bacterium]
MSVRRWIVAAGGLVAGLGIFGFLLGAWGESGGPGTGMEALEMPAPAIAFETLEGERVSVADYRGQVLLLNFWGTWCPPCRREIPELVELQEALARAGGTIIGVAVESGSPQEIRDFTAKFQVNYPIWISDAQKALANYDAMGYPFTLLIDEAGIVRREYLGPQTAASLARDIETFTDLSLSFAGS